MEGRECREPQGPRWGTGGRGWGTNRVAFEGKAQISSSKSWNVECANLTNIPRRYEQGQSAMPHATPAALPSSSPC